MFESKFHVVMGDPLTLTELTVPDTPIILKSLITKLLAPLKPSVTTDDVNWPLKHRKNSH